MYLKAGTPYSKLGVEGCQQPSFVSVEPAGCFCVSVTKLSYPYAAFYFRTSIFLQKFSDLRKSYLTVGSQVCFSLTPLLSQGKAQKFFHHS